MESSVDYPRRRIRVAVLIDRYMPILGGAQNNVHQLCRHLLKRGFQITVLTRRIYKDLPHSERIDGIEVRRFGYARIRVLSKMWCAAAITAWLTRHRHSTDVVMSVPCVRTTDMFPVFFSSFITSLPYVVRSTSMDNFDLLLKRTHGSLGNRLMHCVFPPILYRRVYGRAHAVVVQSEAIRKRARELSIEGCQVIANGVDTARFHPVSSEVRARLREELGLPSDRAIAVYTSRYVWQKNQNSLIKAVERINSRGSGSKIYGLIIGATEQKQLDSNERELRAYVANQGIGDDVRFVNDSSIVERFLQASDLFVMPTISPEGMSNALLEAMACGLPAVVSDQPELRCMFPKGEGVFVDPMDVAGLARHILSLAEDPGRRAADGASLAAHVRKNYSTEAAAQSYARLLRNALGTNSERINAAWD